MATNKPAREFIDASANSLSSSLIDKSIIIILAGQSHAVCAAITDETYLKQLKKNMNISIVVQGNNLPLHCEPLANNHEEPRLTIVITYQCEQDRDMVNHIEKQIYRDMNSFRNIDDSVWDPEKHAIILYGSVYSTLDHALFNPQEQLLGKENCHIKTIENTFGCTVKVDQLTLYRFQFHVYHEQKYLSELVAIVIKGLVDKVHIEYLNAYCRKLAMKCFKGPGKKSFKIEHLIGSS